MDCSLPGFSVHGIFQASVLEWVAISFSRGSSWPRNQTWVSCIAGRCLTLWANREAWKWSWPCWKAQQRVHFSQACRLQTHTQQGLAGLSPASSALSPYSLLTQGVLGERETSSPAWWRPLPRGRTDPVEKRVPTILDTHCAPGSVLNPPPPWSQQSYEITATLLRQKLRLHKGSFPKVTQLENVDTIHSSAMLLLFGSSVVSDSAWTAACQAPISMGFSRQEYQSGLPFPLPVDLPNPGIKPVSPALADRFCTTELPERHSLAYLTPSLCS